jgi:Zn-dependent peptidase ImmA (M78 family)/transcriptional regulator with XRE-family HTH domain
MKAGTPGFIGARLREAREARGLTALQLAELIGVTKQSINMYEKAKSSPSPEVFERAAQVLRVPLAYFLRESLPESTNAVFYRSMAAASQRARTRAERKLGWVKEITAAVAKHVEFPAINVPDLGFPADPCKLSEEMVEAAAQEVRQQWHLGDSIVSNMVLLLENSGVIASRFELESDKLDSFSVWDTCTERPLLILGADKQSPYRSRFDAAHELGHLVMHRNVPKRLLKHTPTLRLVEDQAHHFGRSFLLPSSSFGRDLILPTLNALKGLKPKWKASIGLMIKRAEELRLFSDEQANRLWINRTRQGWHRQEPLDDEVEPERPVLLARSIQLLIDSHVLQKGDLTHSVPLYADDLELLACLPHGYLAVHDEPPTEPEPRLLQFPSAKGHIHRESDAVGLPDGPLS